MTISLNNPPHITGVQISYYLICHRKLWLFSHNIQMEHTSEYVEMGSDLHEYSYKRKEKEIELNGIKIDFYDAKTGVIHEIKKSKAIENAHIVQLKYYIYYFKKLGIEVTGKIDYPLIRRTETVTLSSNDEQMLEKISAEIGEINASEKPPAPINQKICKKCSYYELCYI